MAAGYKKCPGCGLELADQGLEAGGRYHASGECLQLYHELSAHLLMNPDITFIIQHAVDAYSAQHSGDATKNITTAFAVIGLHLAMECGYTGRQVQLAHMELARKSIAWPALDPPTRSYALTVADVLRAEAGTDRNEMLMRWAGDVWQAWEHHHAWARSMFASYSKRY